MPRPVKWRRVEFIPDITHFIPNGVPKCELDENVLKIEELEALRLKDLEGMEQEACAEKMAISRQTFQRILNSARQKLVDSLINGKAIRIEGGNFTTNICPVECLDCGREWKESYENLKKAMNGEYACPNCGSIRLACAQKRGGKYCRDFCHRYRHRHGHQGNENL